MNYKISHPLKEINCEIKLPSSKSISNRLLIIQALCKEKFKINKLSNCDDTEYLKKSLTSKSKIIDIGASGTAFRFMLTFLSIQKGSEYILTGSKRIQERPIKELVDALNYLGAKISYLNKEGYAPLKIIGNQFSKNKVSIRGDISSQFISALILIAPILNNGLTIKIEKELVSSSYVEMTLKIIENFKIKYSYIDNIIKINHQKYKKKDYDIEGDWSAAAFWFQIASLSKKCNIKLFGLNQNSIQGDVKVVDIFSKLGVITEFKRSYILLKKIENYPKFTTINILKFPDVYQALKCSMFGLGINAKIEGTKTLLLKETDRIKAVNSEIINVINDKPISTYNDHRMAMSFAPLSLKYKKIIINDIEVVSKSYPNFWSDLKKSGFKIIPLTVSGS